jgi:hypothetical protein
MDTSTEIPEGAIIEYNPETGEYEIVGFEDMEPEAVCTDGSCSIEIEVW